MEIKPFEIKSQLINTYKYRIEMHAHTNPVSPCGEASPARLVKIYAELGYDAVCITNHFFKGLFDNEPIYQNLSKEEKIDRYIADYEEAKLAGKELGITVILGAELRFIENNNDYLIFGVDKDILLSIYDYLDNTAEYFRRNKKLPESIFIQAHPFRDGCTLLDPTLLDGIETFNSHIFHNSKIPLAVKAAKQNNVDITIAGSDFHHPNTGNEGAAALRTKALPKDSFELTKILKNRDYILEIGENAIVLP
ncbi:MAG: PHP domain-containing protein [Clostridia bacterium]|nr:PHP domain-containing protein [Clostridia bacterium]